jgi:hypothetical protein
VTWRGCTISSFFHCKICPHDKKNFILTIRMNSWVFLVATQVPGLQIRIKTCLLHAPFRRISGPVVKLGTVTDHRTSRPEVRKRPNLLQHFNRCTQKKKCDRFQPSAKCLDTRKCSESHPMAVNILERATNFNRLRTKLAH